MACEFVIKSKNSRQNLENDEKLSSPLETSAAEYCRKPQSCVNGRSKEKNQKCVCPSGNYYTSFTVGSPAGRARSKGK